MLPERNNKGKSLSQRVYERMLLAYPKAHRDEFGPAMVQLFCDQHRDAARESYGWGLTKLWLRTLLDWLNTSIVERFSALNPRKSMSDKISALLRPVASPLASFIIVFSIVFMLALIISIAVTFILPETYASTARIKVSSDQPSISPPGQMAYDPYFIQTTFEVLQSQAVLDPVIEKLNLNEAWGKKYFANEPLKSPETLKILKSRLQLAPVRNTSLISITAFSDDPNEAAEIANAIAESYRDYRTKTYAKMVSKGVAVLEQAYQQEGSQILQMESDVESLRQKFKIDDADASSLAMYKQHIEEQQKVGQREYQNLSSQLNSLKNVDKKQLSDILPNFVTDNALVDLISKRDEARQHFVSLTNSYSLSSPKVVQVQTLISTLNIQIDDRVAGIMSGMKAVVNAKRAALDKLVASENAAIDTKPYWNKKLELQESLDNHKLLLAKIQAEKMEAQLPKTLVQITDRAEPGFSPVRPNKTLDIFIGAVIGGFLGLIAGAISAFVSAKWGGRPKNVLTA